jgi:WD40 repeat protein
MARAIPILGGVFAALGALILWIVPAPLRGDPPATQGQGNSRPAESGPAAESEPDNARQPDPRPALVIPDCRLVPAEREEVPSQREGRLIVIGTEVQSGQHLPPGRQFKEVRFPVLAIALKPDERVPDNAVITINNDGKKYRTWADGDPLQPDQLAVTWVARRFRRLEVGEEVRAGQVLGLVDPVVDHDELAIRKTKLDTAEAERTGSENLGPHLQQHIKRIVDTQATGASSPDQLTEARLRYDLFKLESLGRADAVKLARAELVKANTLVKLLEIRCSVSGVLKDIYKNNGDAVYRLDAVCQVQNTASLSVEGWVDVQNLPLLRKGLEAVVEPVQPVRPVRVLRGHLQEVTGVAVSRGPKPWIVSGSEDHTVRVWDAETGMRRRTLRLPAAVRAVACSPSARGKNLCLAGAADGSARLWDLVDLDRPARELSARHKAAVSCVAFSPDGEWCATGGEDHAICVYKTDTGERLARVPTAHDGAVTSLQFASSSRLVSAGRDNRLLVWDLSRDGRARPAAELDGRTASVNTLGVSPDGRLVFFDRGPELSLLSLADDNEQVAAFRNTTKDLSFTTLALFSPDGSTLLTGGAPEGGLQIWRAPAAARPAAELRRLCWPEAPATCGAFAPDGCAFVVSGTKDGNVLIWEKPSVEEVQRRLTARLTLVEPFVSGTGARARVWAELKNPGGLVAGGSATMVITPAP